MIPRIEQKIELDKSNYLDLLEWMKFKQAKVLYPERIICSRYFDNKNMQMYYETIEGIVPRQKIRIRTYGSRKFLNSNKSYSLEIKKTTEYNRMKKTNKNINLESLLSEGYYNKTYGLCKEIVDISYVREYFLVDNTRLTIDKEISYELIDTSKVIDNKSFEDQSLVLEIKADINTNLTFLMNNFSFPRTRFSKYERALDSLIK
ncbi:VTC domain-containing protein [bacterium]|nr:VTC domain-containing protein [bacterium]